MLMMRLFLCLLLPFSLASSHTKANLEDAFDVAQGSPASCNVNQQAWLRQAMEDAETLTFAVVRALPLVKNDLVMREHLRVCE